LTVSCPVSYNVRHKTTKRRRQGGGVDTYLQNVSKVVKRERLKIVAYKRGIKEHRLTTVQWTQVLFDKVSIFISLETHRRQSASRENSA